MMLSTLLLMGPPAEGGGSGFESLFFLVALFLVFYLFIIRPQSKRQKDIQNKVGSLKKGDKVVTSGGLVGTVHTLEETSLLMEVDKDVKVRLLKSAVVDVNPEKV
jgi:preprotein translocase subunit YajC